jgi:hypothetical protein
MNESVLEVAHSQGATRPKLAMAESTTVFPRVTCVTSLEQHTIVRSCVVCCDRIEGVD